MIKIHLAVLLLFICAAFSFAQDSQKFNVGDTVEAKSFLFNPPWHKAKVISVGQPCYEYKPYRVHFIGPDAGDHGDPCVGADEIRGFETQPPPVANNNKTAVETDARPTGNGAFNIGDRVDVWAANNRDKGARGTIIENTGGQYKVHYDGCEAFKDVMVDRSELHPIATISADAPDITFLIGAWKMFTPSYPNTVVQGNTIYREYGMGAKAPPLRINADGTYVWYDEFNKPPVKGNWTPDAKIEGAKYWTNFVNGVVIKDSKGGQWKVYRWKLAGDNEDRITVHTLCSGLTVNGTRIR
jgi:hypothetical protein